MGNVSLTPEQFRESVLGRLAPEPNTGCSLWTGYTNRGGYGVVGRYGGTLLTHRVVYELSVGPIPDGLCVLHRCDTPPCANPDHLFLGTKADNLRDMHQKGRWEPTPIPGERNGRAILTKDDVRSIRERWAAGATQADLAREYVVGETTIGHIVHRRTWRHM